MATFKKNMPGCSACSCVDTSPTGSTPCNSCGVPNTLTLSWYWNGYNQNPCTTGLASFAGVYGPRSDTLVYNVTLGCWDSGWLRAPCWAGNEQGAAFGNITPCCCLYVRFRYFCSTGTLNVDTADDALGTHQNTAAPCGFAGQTLSRAGLFTCSPFIERFGNTSPTVGPGASGGTIFVGGTLTP